MPFAQQEQIMIALLKGLPNLRGGAFDARGNGQSLAEKMQDTFGADVSKPLCCPKVGIVPTPLLLNPP